MLMPMGEMCSPLICCVACKQRAVCKYDRFKGKCRLKLDLKAKCKSQSYPLAGKGSQSYWQMFPCRLPGLIETLLKPNAERGKVNIKSLRSG